MTSLVGCRYSTVGIIDNISMSNVIRTCSMPLNQPHHPHTHHQRNQSSPDDVLTTSGRNGMMLN
jgi:hypothetical protein